MIDNRFAVFLDIDGTLISDSFRIPTPNLEAIAAARAKGHMVFINTGRSWGYIPDELREQFNVDGVVAGSGAMIIIDGETVYPVAIIPIGYAADAPTEKKRKPLDEILTRI